jgi:hypothetical protein
MQVPSPAFLETVQYASLLHPTALEGSRPRTLVELMTSRAKIPVQYASLLHPEMIRIAFKSIQGGECFVGGSEIDHDIAAKAGFQLDKSEKGSEAPFFSFQRPINGPARAPTGVRLHRRRDVGRNSEAYCAGKGLIRELALAPTAERACWRVARYSGAYCAGKAAFRMLSW